MTESVTELSTYCRPVYYATKSRGRLNPPRLFMYCLQMQIYKTIA